MEHHCAKGPEESPEPIPCCLFSCLLWRPLHFQALWIEDGLGWFHSGSKEIMTLLHSHHQLSGFPVALKLSKEIKMWGLVRVEGGKE